MSLRQQAKLHATLASLGLNFHSPPCRDELLGWRRGLGQGVLDALDQVVHRLELRLGESRVAGELLQRRQSLRQLFVTDGVGRLPDAAPL